ncbi:MAG: ferritin family protein, partial [Paracoccaceae bacterium]|nr:ferritin family protein [Paracoccaceae bacterium]
MRSFFGGRKNFSDLSESEILGLAISSEEDDARIYRGFAERLRSDYPASAKVFEGMALEEDEHRRRLIDRHKVRFGETIPLVRREHVSGFYARRPVWLSEQLPLERMRRIAEEMELQAQSFYLAAA